jgi:hypothetical protein
VRQKLALRWKHLRQLARRLKKVTPQSIRSARANWQAKFRGTPKYRSYLSAILAKRRRRRSTIASFKAAGLIDIKAIPLPPSLIETNALWFWDIKISPSTALRLRTMSINRKRREYRQLVARRAIAQLGFAI